MRTLMRSLAIAVGMLALALTLTMTSAGQAVAQGMKPLWVHVVNTEETAVPVSIVNANELVQFRATFDDSPCPGNSRPIGRVLPDGAVGEPFSVPTGKVLVVTDVDGVIEENVPWTAGRIANLSVFRVGSTSALLARTPITADAVDSRILSLETHVQSGALFSAESVLCVSAFILQVDGFSIADVNQAHLRGYLMPE